MSCIALKGIPVVGSLVLSSFKTNPSTMNWVSLKLPPLTDNPDTPADKPTTSETLLTGISAISSDDIDFWLDATSTFTSC